jgi:hypothetical protein
LAFQPVNTALDLFDGIEGSPQAGHPAFVSLPFRFELLSLFLETPLKFGVDGRWQDRPNDSASQRGHLGGLADVKFDAAVLERLLADHGASATAFEFGLFNGVHLQEAVEMLGIAPGAFVVVVLDVSGRDIDHHRKSPIGKLDQQTANFTAEELGCSLGWLRQTEAPASQRDGGSVTDLGCDRNNVRHLDWLLLVWEGKSMNRKSAGSAQSARLGRFYEKAICSAQSMLTRFDVKFRSGLAPYCKLRKTSAILAFGEQVQKMIGTVTLDKFADLSDAERESVRLLSLAVYPPHERMHKFTEFSCVHRPQQLIHSRRHRCHR